MRLAPLFLALAYVATAEASPCLIQIKPVPKVLTPAGATIATGGGIIVAYRGETSDDKNWRVRAGTQLIAPGIKQIAPGLEVYDVGPATGALVLEDADQTELLAVRRGKPAVLAAPKLKRVWSNTRASLRRGYGLVVAELDATPPGDALALVVYGKDGTARSWGVVKPGVATVTVFSSGGCGTQDTGAVASSQNDSVRLAWVDTAGRISKLSAPITVGVR